MTLIDEDVAIKMQSLKPTKVGAGGAAANSVANISIMGGKAGFLGTVSNDQTGQDFNQSLKKLNIAHINDPKEFDEISGKSYIFITPDADRTMFTYIGSADNITHDDVKYDALDEYKVLFTEAFLWDRGEMSDVVKKSFATMRGRGGLNAFTLSAEFVVKKYREDLLDLMSHIDVLFGNESEYKALFATNNLPAVIKQLQKFDTVSVMTLGKDGAMIILKENVIFVPAPKIKKVVDATGAGDAFAAGFLYGFTHGKSLKECGRLGAQMAGRVIGQIGARLE
jgi:sugar/nucleoside kinase (ribokinase family)